MPTFCVRMDSTSMNSAVEDRKIPFGFHFGIQRKRPVVTTGGTADMLRTEEQ
jgi:hypothetical protein